MKHSSLARHGSGKRQAQAKRYLEKHGHPPATDADLRKFIEEESPPKNAKEQRHRERELTPVGQQ